MLQRDYPPTFSSLDHQSPPTETLGSESATFIAQACLTPKTTGIPDSRRKYVQIIKRR